MWDTFGILGRIVTAIIGYYVTGKKTQKDLDDAFYAWAKFRGRGNESADDRESVENQHERIVEDRMKILMADLDKEVKEQAIKAAKERVEHAEPTKPIVSVDTATLPKGTAPISADGKQDKEA